MAKYIAEIDVNEDELRSYIIEEQLFEEEDITGECISAVIESEFKWLNNSYIYLDNLKKL